MGFRISIANTLDTVQSDPYYRMQVKIKDLGQFPIQSAQILTACG